MDSWAARRGGPFRLGVPWLRREILRDVEVRTDGRVLVTSRDEEERPDVWRAWELAPGETPRERLELLGFHLFFGTMAFEEGATCDAAALFSDLAGDMGTFEDAAFPSGGAEADPARVVVAQAGFAAAFAWALATRSGSLAAYRGDVR